MSNVQANQTIKTRKHSSRIHTTRLLTEWGAVLRHLTVHEEHGNLLYRRDHIMVACGKIHFEE